VHIVRKKGAPYFLKHNKNKISAVVAALIFVAVLWFLSGRIWTLNVVGNQTLDETAVLELCERFGVKIGMKSTDINSAYLRNKVLSKTDKIGFISFNVIGSRLDIEVSEISHPQEKNRLPCNLVATEDGVVKSLQIAQGTPLVKVGDGVKKGDLLVSGVYKREDGVESFVCASGQVVCTVEREITQSTPMTYTENRRAKNCKTQKTFQFFGIDIPLFCGKISGNYELESQTDYLTFNGVKLPIAVTEKRYYEVKPTVVNLNENTAFGLLSSRAELLYINEGSITDVKDNFYTSNGIYVLKRNVIMDNNVAQISILNISPDKSP
ncbi:MAG: sporulation protein YqfD, partial [Oscillospiraceae bacterium]|nr:sporulation protein YqfD [Candidatus Equicaccousia limihippi]